MLPGDFYEFSSTDLDSFNGEVVIEPHTDSPLKGNWPTPTVSRVIQGTVRLQNDLNEPIPISKSQHLALVRRMTEPGECASKAESSVPQFVYNHTATSTSNFSDAVVINPDDYISQQTANS